jgi:hypothetical protein
MGGTTSLRHGGIAEGRMLSRENKRQTDRQAIWIRRDVETIGTTLHTRAGLQRAEF